MIQIHLAYEAHYEGFALRSKFQMDPRFPIFGTNHNMLKKYQFLEAYFVLHIVYFEAEKSITYQIGHQLSLSKRFEFWQKKKQQNVWHNVRFRIKALSMTSTFSTRRNIGGVESIKNKKTHLIFKGRWFWVWYLLWFLRTASKQSLKPHLLKMAPLKWPPILFNTKKIPYVRYYSM